MTPESVGPLSRPVSVANLAADGVAFTVEATAEERAALAKDFALDAIEMLTGAFTLTGAPERVHVVGRIEARIRQICVVSLDPFESTVREEVEVDFASGERGPVESGESGSLEASADRITGTHIDLGALTAEFLALGLDPYPRKPGVAFSFETQDDAPPSPFAKLKALKPDD